MTSEFQRSMRRKLRAIQELAGDAAIYCNTDTTEFEGRVLYEKLLAIETAGLNIVTDYTEDVPAVNREDIVRMNEDAHKA